MGARTHLVRPLAMTTGGTTKLLQNQLKKVLTEPVEGFTAELVDDSSMFEWRIFIEGPPDSPFFGGIYELRMSFPPAYPMEPLTLRFISEFWHPNVYKNGTVCISILHPPGEDAMSGELPEERWLPTQTPTTVILSVMSMLTDPNFSSPANVDASVEWRNNFSHYKERLKTLNERAKKAVPAHVQIPHPDSNEAERKKAVDRIRIENSCMDMDDMMTPSDDAYDYNDDDDDDDNDDDDNDDDDDDDDDDDSNDDEST